MSPTIASASLPRVSALRARLGAAACLLAAAGARSAAGQPSDSLATPPDSLAVPASGALADPGAASPRWQLDAAGLLYGEKGRVGVIEPQARITRLFPDGQTFSATLGLDVITGATPTGAIPTASVQTSTTPSGNLETLSANQVPTQRFNDSRGGLDLEWSKPFGGWFTPTLGTHASIEKDYRSFGGTAKLSVALMRKLTTVTLGAGYNEDRVDPTGGTRAPLSDASVLTGTGPNAKRVRSALAGVSRVLTRRWLLGVTGSRSTERGYLTDPYKVISVLDSSGAPIGLLTDSRPSSRTRKDILASSVYHLTRDILYASYRYYWDDWGVTSHTADARYRLELTDRSYVQPHVRYYFQGRANFFQFGLPQSAPLPAYATSDVRLGDIRTLTLGATYGFHPGGVPGELSLRAEYLRQWGKGSNGRETGEFGEEEGPGPVSGPVDFIPPVDIGSIVVGYSIPF